MSKLAKALTAAAGNAGGESLYVEDVFNTLPYYDTYASSTTNGIDLAGEGGLVWLKKRTSVTNHFLYDTERGANNALLSNSTSAELNISGSLTSFNSDGFTLGTYSNTNTGVAWTFRKAEKFFDVVTYTGNGVAGREIAHNLGSVPACIIIKETTISGQNWVVYHSGVGATDWLALNNSDASTDDNRYFQDTEPTDSVFTVGNISAVNGTLPSTREYVAYLFASDAGGFGDDGSESIIKCGSFTNNSASVGVEVNCGFEPQWLLIKGASTGSGLGNWVLIDSMRGASVDSQQRLYANASTAEGSSNWFKFTSQGFTPNTYFDGDLIYIAIRRPMKTPESGTEVFAMDTAGGTSPTPPTYNSGFPVDFFFNKGTGGTDGYAGSRLQGAEYLTLNSTAAATSSSTYEYDFMDGARSYNWTNSSWYAWMFKRATGFFDVVAYTGDGTTNQTENHNLGVVPEFIITKRRSSTYSWNCYVSALGEGKYTSLNSVSGSFTDTSIWNNTAPTSTQFTLGSFRSNSSSQTYIAYLFATLDGVSKVGSYTGTGSSQNIDCGFSSGARFILIKNVSDNADWLVYDSERGIVAGNDPYLAINSTAAEVTNTDYIDPLNAGFIANGSNLLVNKSGDTYIFLAIA